MAEPEAPDVGALIADFQSALDRYKGEKKDPDEDSDEEPEGQPKNLKQAERVAYIRVRAHNRKARQARSEANSGTPDADDRE